MPLGFHAVVCARPSECPVSFPGECHPSGRKLQCPPPAQVLLVVLIQNPCASPAGLGFAIKLTGMIEEKGLSSVGVVSDE